MTVRRNIILKNVDGSRIAFKNFSGETGPYNPTGKRTFAVFFRKPEDTDFVKQMIKDGWNVKHTKVVDDDGEPTYFLTVEVKFGNYPPKIMFIQDTKTPITEETIDILDNITFDYVDLEITPYNWTMNGKTGVKAYLKTMYVIPAKDVFEDDYADIPRDHYQSIDPYSDKNGDDRNYTKEEDEIPF